MSGDPLQEAWAATLSDDESSNDEVPAVVTDSPFCICGRDCATCHDLEKQKAEQRVKAEEKKAEKAKAIQWANRIYEFDSEDIFDISLYFRDKGFDKIASFSNPRFAHRMRQLIDAIRGDCIPDKRLEKYPDFNVFQDLKKKKELLENQRKTAVYELKKAALGLTEHQLEAKDNPGTSPYVKTQALDRLFGRLMAIVADEMKVQEKLDSFRLTKVLGVSFNENADSLSNMHHEPSGGAYAAKFGGPENLTAEEIVQRAREKRMKRKANRSEEPAAVSTHTVADDALKDEVLALLQPSSKRRRVNPTPASEGTIASASSLPMHSEGQNLPAAAPVPNLDLQPEALSCPQASSAAVSVAPNHSTPPAPIILSTGTSDFSPAFGSVIETGAATACFSPAELLVQDPHYDSMPDEHRVLILDSAESGCMPLVSHTLPDSLASMASSPAPQREANSFVMPESVVPAIPLNAYQTGIMREAYNTPQLLLFAEEMAPESFSASDPLILSAPESAPESFSASAPLILFSPDSAPESSSASAPPNHGEIEPHVLSVTFSSEAPFNCVDFDVTDFPDFGDLNPESPSTDD